MRLVMSTIKYKAQTEYLTLVAQLREKNLTKFNKQST